jgi:glycosyltransferase involved in cell wall biosynthesis
MHIGLVLAAVPAYSETFFVNKIRFLQDSGVQVTVLADNRKTTSFDGCPVVYGVGAVHDGGIGWFVFWRSVWALTKVPGKALQLRSRNRQAGFSSKKNLISLISSLHILPHKLDWLHFGFGTLAIGREHVASVMGARMAVSFRGFDHYVFPLKHPGCYKDVFLQTDKIHVLSTGMKQTLLTQGYKKPVTVITPAINGKDFSSKQNQRTVRNATPLHFCTVARLHWIKGLEYTLEALALLKKQGVAFRYTVVGEGTERERLIFAAYQLGISDSVTFVGKQSPEQIRSILAGADVYIQYSIQEGFCNAVLEAQAMGLLCVVSDAEGLTENVLHEQTGWVVPKRKPDLLAAKIREVIALNDVEARSIQNMAIARVMDAFTIDKQQSAFVQFYSAC